MVLWNPTFETPSGDISLSLLTPTTVVDFELRMIVVVA